MIISYSSEEILRSICPALRQDRLEVSLQEVGYADGAALAGLVELLHGAPRPPQARGRVGRRRDALGPVQQVQVEVIRPKPVEGLGREIYINASKL